MSLRTCPVQPARAAALLAAVGCVAGCTNPFITKNSDRGERTSIARLRSIERLELDKFQRDNPQQTPLPTQATLDKPADRFAGMESVDFALDQVRAATLTGNLDLKVALVDPVLAGEALRQEEAKFEAVFRPGVRYREDDNPTLNTTSSNQQNLLAFNAGVDIPLRTGGRISVDMGESKQDTNNPFVTLNTAYSSNVTFSLSHPLLRNAGREANTHTIRIAAYQEQISQARTKLEVIRQLAAADRAYWRLYAARRALDVTQQQFDLAREQMDKAQRLMDQGAVAEVELIRAQAGVAERLEAIIVAENTVLTTQRELKRLMNTPGLDIDTPIMVKTATEPTPQPFDLDGPRLAEAGVDNRMEMLELELQLAADLSSVDFARNQALPLITLDYQYTVAGLGRTLNDSNGQLWANNFESWSVGLSGQIPIGNEAAKARVQQSILTRLQRLSTKEARRLAIRQEVLNAVDNVQSSWQRILASRQSSLAAGRTLEAERRQFELGARTSTDVLDSATRLAESQLAEIRALTDYQISLVDLSFATGTLLGAAKVEWAPRDPRAEAAVAPALSEPETLEPETPAPDDRP